MPKPNWELSNNVAFFGFLKFSDFQSSRGLDLHVTFQKNKKIHASVYELGGDKQGGNTWMTLGAQGYTLGMTDWYVLRSAVCGLGGSFPAVTGYKDYEEFLLAETNAKAYDLKMIAFKPSMVTSTQEKTFDLNSQSDFPSL